MSRHRAMLTGAMLLAVAFFGHSIVLLVLEPAMGFREFGDFFDLGKIVPALSSAAWRLGNVLHLLVGFGLLFFGSGLRSADAPAPKMAAACAFAAAPLFMTVGMTGIVGDQLVDLLADAAERDAALLGLLLGARTALLYAAVALLGGMLIALSLEASWLPRWLRIAGAAVGVAALSFAALPMPVPLFLLAWSAALLVVTWRGPERPGTR